LLHSDEGEPDDWQYPAMTIDEIPGMAIAAVGCSTSLGSEVLIIAIGLGIGVGEGEAKGEMRGSW